jgi:hypothetical protein
MVGEVGDEEGREGEGKGVKERGRDLLPMIPQLLLVLYS